jgi:hypothetical protein
MLLSAGCVQLRELVRPPSPGVTAEWAVLLGEIRGYERDIGFAPTSNFANLAREQEAFPFCGRAPRLVLPYSYEDPAIEWSDVGSEQACRALAREADIYYGESEALGEVATPLTPAMIDGKLDRFIYLVIHEDCHDQFNLPYGIEEALCDLLTFKAMAAFAAEHYGEYSLEAWAVRRYVETETARVYATITYYDQLAALYARHERKEIPSEVLLRERAVIYKNAGSVLNRSNGELNNVRIANHMTYSRHFPFLEGVYAALGRDLARAVVFFKRVDRLKPSAAAVMKLNRIKSKESLEFVRAYEIAVLETIRKALAEAVRDKTSGAGSFKSITSPRPVEHGCECRSV